MALLENCTISCRAGKTRPSENTLFDRAKFALRTERPLTHQLLLQEFRLRQLSELREVVVNWLPEGHGLLPDRIEVWARMEVTNSTSDDWVGRSCS